MIRTISDPLLSLSPTRISICNKPLTQRKTCGTFQNMRGPFVTSFSKTFPSVRQMTGSFSILRRGRGRITHCLVMEDISSRLGNLRHKVHCIGFLWYSSTVHSSDECFPASTCSVDIGSRLMMFDAWLAIWLRRNKWFEQQDIHFFYLFLSSSFFLSFPNPRFPGEGPQRCTIRI